MYLLIFSLPQELKSSMKNNKLFIPIMTGLLMLLSFGTASAEVIYDNIVFPEPVIFDDDMEFWAELDAEGNVYMDWSKYSHAEPFEFYKIVRSQNNDNPIYPEDGYIYFTDDVDLMTFTDTEVPFGDSYYRICHVAGGQRYCSTEMMKIFKKAPILLDKSLQMERIAIDPDLLTLEPKPGVEPIVPPAEEDIPAEKPPLDERPILDDRPVLDERPIRDNLAEPESKNQINSIESFFSEYWVQFLALVVSLLGVALAVTGFTLAGAKKKKSISKLLNDIDDTFASFKWKTKRCEAELYRLQDVVEDQLKSGKLDEGAYQLLLRRIEKYLTEIQEIENLPEHLKEK